MMQVIEGLADPAAAATLQRHGPGDAAATMQAEAVFDRLHSALAAIGCVARDVCKITMRITDRTWREPVYAVLGRRLAGVFPVSTGLIVAALPDPAAVFALDAYVVPGGPHERLRRYRSSDGAYGLQRQAFSMEFCMVVRAGRAVFLRGQTGSTLDRQFPHLGNPAAQAQQAVANIRTLLADAGAEPRHATHIMTYATDAALFGAVQAAVRPTFAGALVQATEMMVKGLAAPEMLLEIDVIAGLPADVCWRPSSRE